MPRQTRQEVTIRHVAAEAGVSLQTVSRVINNEPNVRAQMKERVQEAVRKLGYVPSLAARRLGGSRSYLIMALNDRDRTIEAWQLGQGTDYIDQMLYGGMLTCAEHGYRMVFELVDTHSEQVEREVLAAISALHPDGIILTPPHSDNPAITDLLAAKGMPFARIGSDLAGPGFAVSMDDRAAARVVTERLVELGHRRIGFITGSPEYRLSEQRMVGYREALDRHALGDPALIANGDFSYESGRAGAQRLLTLADPATAIIASSEQMALATLHRANALGLAVPSEVSIVSFDNTPITRFSVPPLTAVSQPIAPMTSKAAALLIALASDRGDPASDSRHVVPFELIERGSTGPR